VPLVGAEAVTPEGLKDVHKNVNLAGEVLVQLLRKFQDHGVHVLGPFIFGLPGACPFGSAEYEAQEPGDEGEPDIKRPPEPEIPEFDGDHPEAPNEPGAPPFTGEDVEDVGRRRKRDTPPVM
jgi:hypothetical protein